MNRSKTKHADHDLVNTQIKHFQPESIKKPEYKTVVKLKNYLLQPQDWNWDAGKSKYKTLTMQLGTPICPVSYLGFIFYFINIICYLTGNFLNCSSKSNSENSQGVREI